MHIFLLLTFFAFSANLVQKIVWVEKTENVAENDDSDDSDDTDDEENTDDEEKRERTEWFAELPSFDCQTDQDYNELTATGFPDMTSDLPEAEQNQLKSPPECMC